MKLDTILNGKGREVATIRPEATVNDLLAELAQRRIGALVVSVDGSKVDGMVSERDVVRALSVQGPSVLTQPVSSIMSRVVQCAPTNASVGDIMQLMTQRRIRHVPVVDDSGEMVGLVSIGDIVKSRLGELEGERDALMEYVTRG
jgi:CBS domain-containing protein